MIVEDGSIVANADSLVDEEFADAYAEARFINEWDATPDKEAALVLGTSWVLSRNSGKWKGYIVDPAQSLPWPRIGVYDEDGRLLPHDEIPVALKQAIVEAAMRFGRGEQLNADPPTAGVVQSQRTRVGPIEESITYAAGTTSSRAVVPVVDDLIRGLVRHGSGNVRPLLRWF